MNGYRREFDFFLLLLNSSNFKTWCLWFIPFWTQRNISCCDSFMIICGDSLFDWNPNLRDFCLYSSIKMTTEKAPAMDSCRKKKSDDATFLQDVKDHIDEFVHASMDEHKTCFKKTISKVCFWYLKPPSNF